MTLRAEPAYFSGHNLWRGLDWYEDQFRGSEGYAARGEWTPGYTMYPTFTERATASGGPGSRRQAHLPGSSSREEDALALPAPLRLRHRADRLTVPCGGSLTTSTPAATPSDRAVHGALRPRPSPGGAVRGSPRRDRRSVLRQISSFWGRRGLVVTDLEREFNVTRGARLRRPLVKKVMSSDLALRVAERVPETAKRSIRTVSHRPPPAHRTPRSAPSWNKSSRIGCAATSCAAQLPSTGLRRVGHRLVRSTTIPERHERAANSIILGCPSVWGTARRGRAQR